MGDSPAQRLVMKSWGTDEVAFSLLWCGGEVEVESVAEDLRSAVERWLQHGVTEWIGSRRFPCQRTTRPESPDFLANLRDYLLRQTSSLEITLEEVSDG